MYKCNEEHKTRVEQIKEQHEIVKKAIKELVELTREEWKESKKAKKKNIFLGNSIAEDKIQLEFLQYGAEICNLQKGTIKLYDKAIAEKQIHDARKVKKANAKKKKKEDEEKKQQEEQNLMRATIKDAVKEAVI